MWNRCWFLFRSLAHSWVKQPHASSIQWTKQDKNVCLHQQTNVLWPGRMWIESWLLKTLLERMSSKDTLNFECHLHIFTCASKLSLLNGYRHPYLIIFARTFIFFLDFSDKFTLLNQQLPFPTKPAVVKLALHSGGKSLYNYDGSERKSGRNLIMVHVSVTPSGHYWFPLIYRVRKNWAEVGSVSLGGNGVCFWQNAPPW